jgi:DNA gyrase/topoisomerase IV subunit B
LVIFFDSSHRGERMTSIRVTIDQENNVLSIYNDGAAIPVVMHTTEKMFVPGLIQRVEHFSCPHNPRVSCLHACLSCE